MNSELYTIGHSNHSLAHFIELLKQHSISAISDVRSTPYSQANPQFNRETLKGALADQGISYVFMGKELGGRSEDPSHYKDGRVQYNQLAKRAEFKEGLSRLMKGMSDYRIALVCAEKDPAYCHRTIPVCRKLEASGISIRHILEDGTIEPQEDTEKRLMKLHGIQPDMFHSEEQCVEEAYRRQEERISYVDKAMQNQEGKGTGELSLYTIGFTKKSAEQFFESLRKSKVKRVIDIRLNNISQLAGFTKKNDLKYFLKQICGIDYLHMPELAPTKSILDAYKKKGADWQLYERQFLALLAERGIEHKLPKETIDGACLLCSEEKPEKCHRRLVAEYLKEKWGNLRITHLSATTGKTHSRMENVGAESQHDVI